MHRLRRCSGAARHAHQLRTLRLGPTNLRSLKAHRRFEPPQRSQPRASPLPAVVVVVIPLVDIFADQGEARVRQSFRVGFGPQ